MQHRPNKPLCDTWSPLWGPQEGSKGQNEGGINKPNWKSFQQAKIQAMRSNIKPAMSLWNWLHALTTQYTELGQGDFKTK